MNKEVSKMYLWKAPAPSLLYIYFCQLSAWFCLKAEPILIKIIKVCQQSCFLVGFLYIKIGSFPMQRNRKFFAYMAGGSRCLSVCVCKRHLLQASKCHFYLDIFFHKFYVSSPSYKFCIMIS